MASRCIERIRGSSQVWWHRSSAAILSLFLIAAASAQTLPPGQIRDGRAPVEPANTQTDTEDGIPLVTLIPDPVQARRPVLRENADREGEGWLRDRVARGWAAGMTGFVYDNRDRGHSVPKMHHFPQLAKTAYAPVYKDRGLDYGLAGPFRFSTPILGNSSTALTRGPFARSQPRVVAGGQASAARAFRLYETNHLYFYPEHRDHDPGTGDRFFANMPFFVVSQGSSGSDLPLLRAAFMTLAAMRPETFTALERAGLIAPTLQMLLRHARPQATDPGSYMSGPAHPSAFAGKSVNTPLMMAAAHALTPDAIPPMVRLKVIEDFAARPGVDYPDPLRTEKIFTTPAAIARAWRSPAYRREIVLDAADTTDPNGRELVFDWVVLRGDPDKIRITHEPDDPARTRARIEIDWHDAYPVPGRDDLMTSRVDIGVFARNGATVSAPSFMSVAFPVHQARRYEPGPDGEMRPVQIDYRRPRDGTGYAGRYVDPALWALADWTDSYAYASQPPFETVTRHYGDGSVRTFRRGLLGLYAPDATQPVRYRAATNDQGRPVIFEEGTGAP